MGKIKTPDGVGIIEKIWVSELGFLMIKVEHPKGIYKGHNLGKFNALMLNSLELSGKFEIV